MSWLRPVPVLPVVLALVALGCVGVPRASAGEAQPVPAVSAVPRAVDTLTPPVSGGPTQGWDGTGTIEEFRADMATAQHFAERYWKARLAADGVRFTPVREVIPYTVGGEISCGDEPIAGNNAAYCAAGDFIAYDVDWAYGAFQQVGDAFIYYLLGHEYAHAIQVRLGIRKEFTIQQELQADCMAGAYLGDSARGPGARLRVSDSDIDEFRRGLTAVGDDPGQPWFAEDAHGSARQRIRSFVDGYENSLAACSL